MAWMSALFEVTPLRIFPSKLSALSFDDCDKPTGQKAKMIFGACEK